MLGMYAVALQEAFLTLGMFAVALQERFPSQGMFPVVLQEPFPTLGMFQVGLLEVFPKMRSIITRNGKMYEFKKIVKEQLIFLYKLKKLYRKTSVQLF